MIWSEKDLQDAPDQVFIQTDSSLDYEMKNRCTEEVKKALTI